MWTRRSFAVVASAALVMGCNDIAGLSDLEFVGPPGGIGGGGTGGGGALPAADWSEQMIGLWEFDDDADVGRDSSQHGHGLIPQDGAVALSSSVFKRGRASLELGAASGQLSGSHPGLWIAPATGFTVGLWVQLGGGMLTTIAGSSDESSGYLAERNSLGRFECGVYDSADSVYAESPALLPVGQWVHLACRSDGALLSAFEAGTLRDSVDVQGKMDGAELPFQVSDAVFRILGFVDEIFLVDDAITDAAIRRIRACGVDGTACSCRPEAPGQYESCGDLPDCGALPPCDQPDMPRMP